MPTPPAARPVPRDDALPGPHAAVVQRLLAASAEDAFDLLTDVRNHARWVPLTRVDAPGRVRLGDAFTAVTGPRARAGGAGLPDGMVVERLEPPSAGGPGPASPGVAVFRKTGPVLTGVAEVRVRPLGERLCEVVWAERIGVRGVPGSLTDAVGRGPTTAMVALVLHRAARELAGR